MEDKIEFISAILKEQVEVLPCTAILDLTPLDEARLDWILGQKIISLPILVRVMIALRQNGVTEILIQYSPGQERVREQIARHPIVGGFVSWYPVEEGDGPHHELISRINQHGSYWIHPSYLINGIFLRAFEAKFDRQGSPRNLLVENNISSGDLFWIAPHALDALSLRNGTSLASFLEAQPKRKVVIENTDVKGYGIHQKRDLRKAEKLLCEDVTRKKGGFVAKILNEPISLWLAKQCAKTSVSPNTITVFNTLLGLLSAALVWHGGRNQTYWPLALGGILFYAVDIFDGIDGELARLTFRFSKHGALYDTISDNVTLLAFIAASFYAGYMRTPHGWVIAAGIFSVTATFSLILYFYFFTTHYFGNASLRLYEARFMPLIPLDRRINRYIFTARLLYTKDIFAALLSFGVIINFPLFNVIFTPLLLVHLILGLVYLGIRYGHLLKK